MLKLRDKNAKPRERRSANFASIGHACLRALQLLMPVLLPSWRFFDRIGPAPRIDYCVHCSQASLSSSLSPPIWHALPLTLQHVSVRMTLMQLFFNPSRNDLLYLLSCCERVLEDGRNHAQREILLRVTTHATQQGLLEENATTLLQFRIREVQRIDAKLVDAVMFESTPIALAELTRSNVARRA